MLSKYLVFWTDSQIKKENEIQNISSVKFSNGDYIMFHKNDSEKVSDAIKKQLGDDVLFRFDSFDNFVNDLDDDGYYLQVPNTDIQVGMEETIQQIIGTTKYDKRILESDDFLSEIKTLIKEVALKVAKSKAKDLKKAANDFINNVEDFEWK